MTTAVALAYLAQFFFIVPFLFMGSSIWHWLQLKKHQEINFYLLLGYTLFLGIPARIIIGRLLNAVGLKIPFSSPYIILFYFAVAILSIFIAHLLCKIILTKSNR